MTGYSPQPKTLWLSRWRKGYLCDLYWLTSVVRCLCCDTRVCKPLRFRSLVFRIFAIGILMRYRNARHTGCRERSLRARIAHSFAGTLHISNLLLQSYDASRGRGFTGRSLESRDHKIRSKEWLIVL
jgi:hypothetical protein